jgi:hypothetical protein
MDVSVRCGGEEGISAPEQETCTHQTSRPGISVSKFWQRMSGTQHEFSVCDGVRDCCVAAGDLTDRRPRKGGWK